MWGISKRSATARIAASETQPSCCSWTRHRIEIAADAWRPGGYFAISFLAQARFSSVNVKLAGCNSFGARRRTDISSHLSLHAGPGTRIKRADPVLPERACGAEHVVTDVGGNLDTIEDRQFGDGLHSAGARIIDDQLQRRLLQNVARHGMLRIVTVLFAKDHAIGLEQPRTALDRLDFDALDVELDQIFAACGYLAVVYQTVERDNGHLLAAAVGAAGDAEGFMLAAGEIRLAARRADRAFHQFEATAVGPGVVGKLWKILRGGLDRNRPVRTERRARHQDRPVAVIGTAVDQSVVDVCGMAEQQFQLVLVIVGPVEQLAPIAVAVGKFENSAFVQLDGDVALGQHLAQEVGATDVAAMREVRRYLRSGRQRECSRPLP